MGNFGEVFNLANSVKIAKLKTELTNIDYCTRAYGTKNSDRQIKISPIPTESQFAKFNAHQTFPLYGTTSLMMIPTIPSRESSCLVNYSPLGVSVLVLCPDPPTSVALKMGYASLRQEQRDAIVAFLRGRDVFVPLPTGSSKSLCYAILPKVFDILWGKRSKSFQAKHRYIYTANRLS